MRLPLPLLSLRRRVAALFRSILGRVQFRLGALACARRNFERVLELSGDDFCAYVHLARIDYTLGEVRNAIREFDNARRTDPERFARLTMPHELRRPSPVPMEEFSERAVWSPAAGLQGTGIQDASTPATHAWWRGVDGPGMDPDLDGGAEPAGAGRDGFGFETATAAGPTVPGLQAPGERAGVRSGPGDFSSAEEAERFRGRPPIAREEIAAVDWDRLLREIDAA